MAGIGGGCREVAVVGSGRRGEVPFHIARYRFELNFKGCKTIKPHSGSLLICPDTFQHFSK